MSEKMNLAKLIGILGFFYLDATEIEITLHPSTIGSPTLIIQQDEDGLQFVNRVGFANTEDSEGLPEDQIKWLTVNEAKALPISGYGLDGYVCYTTETLTTENVPAWARDAEDLHVTFQPEDTWMDIQKLKAALGDSCGPVSFEDYTKAQAKAGA